MAQVRSVLETPIFHKLYDLYKLLHAYLGLIPKSQRYSLWLKCENTTLILLETLIEIGHRTGNDRLQALYVISDKLDVLKVLFRLAKDTRTIDSKQYLAIQTHIQEIGKMVGGWIKSVPL
jgi:hypothetical protein